MSKTRRWGSFSLFYPMSLAIIVAMIGVALKPGVERAQAWGQVVEAISTTGLVVQGDDLGALALNEGTSSQLDGPMGAIYAVIGSSGDVMGGQSFGARYSLPADAVKALQGREVELSFDVRSAADDGSDQWLARIAVGGLFDTGWLLQQAENEWRTVRARVAIPTSGPPGPMEIMMWSDALGGGRRIELRSIGITPLSPA